MLLVVFFSALITSCSDTGSTAEEQARREAAAVLRVAVTPTLDCLPLFVAEATGMADSLGRHLVLQQHMARADCDTALVGGSVCAILTDCGRAAFLRDNWTTLLAERKATTKRQNAKMPKQPNAKTAKQQRADTLSVMPHGNLRLFLLTNYKARLKEAKQLADKMIALDRKSVEADMAQYVLDSVKLADKTFLVNIPSLTVRREMIGSNIMDAVVLPEPQATVVRRAGHSVIYAASAIAGRDAGCLVARRDAALLRRIYNQACDTLNTVGLHRYDSLLVKRMGLTPDAARAVRRITFKKI